MRCLGHVVVVVIVVSISTLCMGMIGLKNDTLPTFTPTTCLLIFALLLPVLPNLTNQCIEGFVHSKPCLGSTVGYASVANL